MQFTFLTDVLDRVISSMRDASARKNIIYSGFGNLKFCCMQMNLINLLDPALPPSLRLAIFQLVELRAAKWNLPTDTTQYYRQRRHLNAVSLWSVGSVFSS